MSAYAKQEFVGVKQCEEGYMDIKDIKELIRFFDKSGVAELEIEQDDVRVYMSKQIAQPMMQMPMQMPMQMAQPMAMPAPAAAEQPAHAVKDNVMQGNVIESPMIGTFYEAASPDAPSFVSVGDKVEKGQILCIIEAMKIMNTIEAEYPCKILSVMAENGKPVEFGQPIFMVEPL
jgi:acetyl-CoA carboxylase biotin carboxyl carrier protein